MNKKQKGAYGEFLARLVLRLKGYRILQKNYITGRGVGAGEIDIIAKKGRCIVFVEVKERKTKENALYAIKPEQQKRIIRAARNYMAKHKAYQNFDVRFDAVLVSNFCLTHIKNAWCL
ncbi:MAG: YraN family protein [Alphaproteobacteria bacterium]|nr:YraN family protein [Alphaproteobacteria bacterium]